MASITALELAWWAINWSLGIAPLPLLGLYLLFGFATLAGAMAVRAAFRLGPPAARWPAVIVATFLVGAASSAFLPLKYAIPRLVPFWLDRPLAVTEAKVLGTDPWLLLDRILGWATVPMDWLYGCWLPVQSLILFLVILARPSRAKSRALIAYVLAWFVLGVVAALVFSSAGPLFYDRLFGGRTFAALPATLRERGAWIALAESEGMWRSLASGRPTLVAGISAVPSLHVAISLWMVLTARAIRPGAVVPALLYFVAVWIGSVQLGWHYASDGLVGAVGMLALWKAAGGVLNLELRRAPRAGVERLRRASRWPSARRRLSLALRRPARTPDC